MVPAGVTVCSFTTTWPPGIGTVWFGSPVTAIGTPPIDRLSMREEPLPAPPSTAVAVAITKSAEMPTPPTFNPRFAREADEAT